MIFMAAVNWERQMLETNSQEGLDDFIANNDIHSYPRKNEGNQVLCIRE